jgi:riboflavin kinase/FMN adenylyltransferase
MTTLFRDVAAQARFPAGSVLAIGAFDGVHRGHQRLLAGARASARRQGLPAVALSFEPLPREYFARNEPPARLTPARAKYELLREAGMDAVALLRFDQALAAMPADAFIDRVLVRALAARTVWVGPDFRFGQARAGDIDLLRDRGAALGFDVEVATEVRDAHGLRIGATRIRQALAAGAFLAAGEGLGRPYSIAGRVIRGRQLGRKLGFPTANIAIPWRPAVRGVLAVRVHGPGLQAWPGVASLGTRPTVGGGPSVLESHLFDFDGDLYGQRLQIEFVAGLREERHFDSLDAMIVQMHEDARQARAALAIAPADAA